MILFLFQMKTFFLPGECFAVADVTCFYLSVVFENRVFECDLRGRRICLYFAVPTEIFTFHLWRALAVCSELFSSVIRVNFLVSKYTAYICLSYRPCGDT